MVWSSYVLDKFVAPKLSALVAPTPVKVAYDEDLFATNFLTSVLLVQWPEEIRILISILIRRFTASAKYYNSSIDSIEDYIAKRNQGEQPSRTYLSAIDQMESSFIQAQVAIATVSKISTFFGGDKVFVRNDGSLAERVTRVSNRIKHFDEDVYGGVAATTAHCTPLWLTDLGVESSVASLTYNEYQEVLKDLYANCKFVAITAPENLRTQTSSNPTP